MLIRFSTCIGLDIVSESTTEVVGQVADILIEPDSGSIAGFFAQNTQYPSSELPFIAAFDIIQWGAHIHIQSPDVIYPAGERIRITPLLEDGRRLIGQRVQAEDGRVLGVCKDVQFNTETMHIEWIFPKHFFRWGTPLPVKDIIEVTPKAIVVKDPAISAKEKIQDTGEVELFEPLTEATS